MDGGTYGRGDEWGWFTPFDGPPERTPPGPGAAPGPGAPPEHGEPSGQGTSAGPGSRDPRPGGDAERPGPDPAPAAPRGPSTGPFRRSPWPGGAGAGPGGWASLALPKPLKPPAGRGAFKEPPPVSLRPGRRPSPPARKETDRSGSVAQDVPGPRTRAVDRTAGRGDSLSTRLPDTAVPSTPPPRGDAPSPDTVLIRRTMAELEPVADRAVSYFYALLFLHRPELRPLFPPAMDAQRDRLFKALLTAARHADDAGTLTAYLSALGRGHRKYGTRAEHYPAVGEALIGALARYAPRTWNDEAEAAWVRVYTVISQVMIDAAAEDELTSPPWWQAEIVGHELCGPDAAVVTLRPDQPYPFLAGQYAGVETPWWPRIWRHYSFSCAPRPDGLLSFHVKAVPAGWVSGALVHRARPGAVLRLGPPAGSMIVDHTTDNGLLCLGGGTGIAPIKALVEDVAAHGVARPVEVFYGARRDGEFHVMDALRELEQEHSWLSVRPVVADGPKRALSGQLSSVVREYGPWKDCVAYLSGPPEMIRSGVDTLVGVGIPSHRIRHDSIHELLAATG
ncbi:globin domain-containing protein [Streptomyces luteireticuli]|uniref:nitric oxide dioxygenase n=1 Tax=Streptomyces luteireticuli TaxID=173858 RepID=A0ABN0YZE3_9ACTN